MGEKDFFSQEELTRIKKDVNKPNGDCLASPCCLAPFQPKLLLNYPENRRKEPCTPAFLAAFVSDLCQSVLKQEPGSGTLPSLHGMMQKQMAAANLAQCPRLCRLLWAMALPEL